MADIERTPRIDLTSAGVAVGYSFETTAGTRPSGPYTHLAGVSDIPEMNESPEMIDTTTLDELTERVGKPGLKALPSATGFTVNYTETLKNQWKDVMSKYNAGKDSGKRMWATVVFPGISDAFFFPVEPSPLGVPGVGVGNVLSTTVYMTKVGEVEMDTAPEIVAWSGASSSGLS